MNCPCCSGKLYSECCEPFHQKKKFAKNAEELMRSRYSAYVFPNADYLWETTIPENRKFYDKQEMEDWGKANTWNKLEIVNTSKSRIEFKAYYTNPAGKSQIHHEISTFKNVNNRWYYVSGVFME